MVAIGFAAKVFCLRPRSGLNENSPALQRWGGRLLNRKVREADD